MPETVKVGANVAFPLPLVFRKKDPKNVCPSPNPDGSAVELAKNSMVNAALGVLLSEPVMVT